jgi:hypothetical protein
MEWDFKREHGRRKSTRNTTLHPDGCITKFRKENQLQSSPFLGEYFKNFKTVPSTHSRSDVFTSITQISRTVTVMPSLGVRGFANCPGSRLDRCKTLSTNQMPRSTCLKLYRASQECIFKPMVQASSKSKIGTT